MSVDASIALLRWYDLHRRDLPWRARPGDKPDPYHVWLSEIMLQQTTVAAVRGYFESFVARWPTVTALAQAEEGAVMAAWAGLGYYARARNLIACARQVAKRGGIFPDSEDELRRLPGIGRYTAAAIAAIAFGKRAVVVDANVERVVSRYFAVGQPLPSARSTLYALADTITPAARSGDFAQAMMDLGATICTRCPACAICPLMSGCAARRRGDPGSFPIKAARPPKPRKRGIAYWLEQDGDVLLVRRPGAGLLGGMLALPSGDWSETPDAWAPADAEWSDAGSIHHVFTHFSLDIRLLCAEATRRREAGEIWWPVRRIGEAGLPTVFAKLAARGVEWRSSV